MGINRVKNRPSGLRAFILALLVAGCGDYSLPLSCAQVLNPQACFERLKDSIRVRVRVSLSRTLDGEAAWDVYEHPRPDQEPRGRDTIHQTTVTLPERDETEGFDADLSVFLPTDAEFDSAHLGIVPVKGCGSTHIDFNVFAEDSNAPGTSLDPLPLVEGCGHLEDTRMPTH